MIKVGGRQRGGGFHIRADLVVTAAHVIGKATPGEVSFVIGDEPGSAVVQLEVAPEFDLALLHLATPDGDDRTVAGRVTAGDEWMVLTRPDVNAPALAGSVTIPARRIDNVSRHELDVIQLHVRQRLDNFQGYSGSAVRLRGDPSVVLGVLVEQVKSRQAQPDPPAVDVLYAVPIGMVLSRFRLDDIPAADEVVVTPLGDYSFHVQVLQVAALEGRDGERAAMAKFCRGPLRAMRWTAPPKAGKTALLADFVLRPPAETVVAAFFVNRALTRHDDSDDFLDHVVPQLERIAGVPPNPEPRATGYFQRVLHAAAATAGRQDRVLVLVIDGLDEDAGLGAAPGPPPIPALLNKIPARVKVIAAGREHPGLPADLGPDNPLRTAQVTALAPAPAAMMTVQQAIAELEWALASQEDLRRRILGLVLASKAGLSAADLRELTDTPTVAATLRSSFGRVLREQPTSNDFGWIAQPAYGFSHDALRRQAQDYLAHDLPERHREIRTWSDAYRQPLPVDGDRAALLAAAVNHERHDRMLYLLGVDDAALREVEAGSRLAEVPTSLTTLCRLAIEYERLTERASSVPTRLPAVWARLGQPKHAARSVNAIQHAELREEAIGAANRAFAGEDTLDLKKRYVRTTSAEQDVENLADTVVTLAAIGNHARALELVRALRRMIRRAWGDLVLPAGRVPLLRRLGKSRILALPPTVLANVALAAAAVGQTGAALALLEAVQDRWAAGAAREALGRWAEVALLAGRPDLADAFAGHALDEAEESSGYGVDDAIWACAVAGRVDDALRLAALPAGDRTADPEVARAAEALARSGNEAAARQILQAVRTHRVGAGGLAEIAKVFTLRRDLRAAQRCVEDLADDADQAEALTDIAWAAAVTSNPEASRLALQAASVAYGVVDAGRAVEVQTAIATALARTGHDTAGRQWVEAATATARGRDDAGLRGTALARVALALAEAGRADEADRMALAALEAAEGPAYSRYLKGCAFAEAARALAVTGHHDQAHDAAGVAWYSSMYDGARFYTWWTRTLVVVLVHLSTTGHHDFAVRLAESLASEDWRHWTLAAIERQELKWSGHDWRGALDRRTEAESIPEGIADPNGQEEALRQIAEGLGTAVAAGGPEAEAIHTALRRVAAQRQAWTELLPVIAVAEPAGIPDIAEHAAKAWPLRPHPDSRNTLRCPEVRSLATFWRRDLRWDVLRGRPLRGVVETEV